MVVWVYAGGGHSELGIVPWLQAHFGQVTFLRRTPQISKPGPRLGVQTNVKVVGQTGSDLVSKIRNDLKKYWGVHNKEPRPQVILLLDDTDCAAPDDRDKALREAVVSSIDTSNLPSIVVALARPELEVWLLADWANTFEKNYRSCHVPMKRRLMEEGVNFNALEDFDCRCDTPTYRKLSETIADAFNMNCETSVRYSKSTDTPRLLIQANPINISEKCPRFKKFWLELNQCVKKTTD